jgi:dynein intermediate chain
MIRLVVRIIDASTLQPLASLLALVQSDVLSIIFSPFQPNLIFGGTSSGQILLWDTRCNHHPVVQPTRSLFHGSSPIHSLKIVGTQKAHHLISSSANGSVCSWSTDNLNEPQVYIPFPLPLF